MRNKRAAKCEALRIKREAVWRCHYDSSDHSDILNVWGLNRCQEMSSDRLLDRCMVKSILEDNH